MGAPARKEGLGCGAMPFLKHAYAKAAFIDPGKRSLGRFNFEGYHFRQLGYPEVTETHMHSGQRAFQRLTPRLFGLER